MTDLTGEHAERWRRWDSCFTLDHSYLHGGSVRTSARARYRQWLDPQAGELDRSVRHVGLRRLRPLHHVVPGRHRHHRGGGGDPRERRRSGSEMENADGDARADPRRSTRSSRALDAAASERCIVGCAANVRFAAGELPLPRRRGGEPVLPDPRRAGRARESRAPGAAPIIVETVGDRRHPRAGPGSSRPTTGSSTRARSSRHARHRARRHVPPRANARRTTTSATSCSSASSQLMTSASRRRASSCSTSTAPCDDTAIAAAPTRCVPRRARPRACAGRRPTRSPSSSSRRPTARPFAPGQFNMLYVFGVGEVPISMSGDPARPDTLVHTDARRRRGDAGACARLRTATRSACAGRSARRGRSTRRAGQGRRARRRRHRPRAAAAGRLPRRSRAREYGRVSCSTARARPTTSSSAASSSAGASAARRRRVRSPSTAPRATGGATSAS